jgi:serine O-acetyltransferase
VEVISRNKAIYQRNFLANRIFMDRQQTAYWITEIFDWMFTTRKEFLSYSQFEQKELELHIILRELLLQEQFTPEEASRITEAFFTDLQDVYALLAEDLKVAISFDPAATSMHEILFSYPGFFAIAVHRISYYLWHHHAQILARVFAEIAHSKTGIDIHPAAVIGKRFFIDHGTGVVIGETCIIGEDVKIYQGVTLGALSVSRDLAHQKRHPTIEDHVIIYANATILGGHTVIGKNSIVGGNVWLTSSLPPNAQIFHKSETIIKRKPGNKTAVDFSI